ncbi:ABC transporter ATP-binding protein [Endomicrobium proavitum]|uniref:ABC transporter ATP-binding component n=1 Tax=Endomicrobium proavitum TaxID=1408281 RepID=A0A0G3WK28_9BACT|nr:ATP-binding cassette domain-containing protein [Endomicrobium proavitum]AKL98250.1 ABC transporter ATP-binding component [Endomicrobium proavitum]
MEKIDKQFIEFRNVSVLRQDRFILNDVNLSIASDENVAVIGPNGSGKSTFIKLITGNIYPSYTGDNTLCRLFGRDKWNISDLRQSLGIVTSELQNKFQTDITGFETVLSGFFSSVGIAKNHTVTLQMEEKARKMIEFLEVSRLKQHSIDTMSSGEARRFLIARALVNEPKVLVLDEPSNSLDIASAAKLHAVMRKIAAAGTKIILVTHLASDIIPEINRFIFFKDGKVFADGERAKVFTSEKLSQLFDMDVELTQKNGFCWLNGK